MNENLLDNNKSYFLKIIEAFVKGTVAFECDDSVDWNIIYKLSVVHSLQSVIYIEAKKMGLNLPEKINEKLKNDFLKITQNSVMQEMGMKNVINTLNLHGIKHILYKGYILRNYYPVPEARTMGDIDFLIQQVDREKSDKALKEIGFEYCKEESDELVWNYMNPMVYLEVHTNLIHQMTFSGTDYGAYFSDVWSHLTHKENMTYELKKEYHFIYILVHLAKHFYHIGAGIRMFLDVCLFTRYYKNDLDWEQIITELKKIKLYDFAINVFSICNHFLGADIPYGKEFTESEYEILDYVLDIGVFGHNRESKNFYSISFGTSTAGKKGIRGFYNKICVFFKLVFPAASSQLPPGESKWKLPLAWVKRWIKIFTTNRHLLGKQLNGVFGENKEAVYHKKILGELGLDNEG